jgi:hypothetical protein
MLLAKVPATEKEPEMPTKFTALVCLIAAAAIATSADAGSTLAKQRVAVQHIGTSFVLTPLTPGAVKPDTGPSSFCCWTERPTTRDGEAIEINDPQMTLTGKRGTLVARNGIGYVDISNGWSIFTGTWKVIRGTGQYAGLAGGGLGAGISTPNGAIKARFEGLLGSR